MNSNDIESLPSNKISDEEKYYYEQSWKEPIEGMVRIEETAKFLLGSATTTSGLYLAAFKISKGTQTVSSLLWFLPFLFWSMGILCFLFVLLPQTYQTGKNEPNSWKSAYIQAKKYKYQRLFLGTCFFIFGIFSAVIPFFETQ